jgi:type II secretory pathway component PulK
MKKAPNLKPIRNEKGVAMMMAMITMLLMTILAAELVYETTVYNNIVFRQVDQLRARMLARSGMRLALLQVRAAKKAGTKAKGILGDSAGSLVDQLWQTPLILPPPAVPGVAGMEAEGLTKFGTELSLGGVISVNISGENSRLSLNQLVWNKPAEVKPGTASPGGASAPGGQPPGAQPVTQPVTPEQQKAELTQAREALAKVVDQLLQNKRETDEKFNQRAYGLNGQILVGNLLAWMDPATEVDGENRDKKDYYARHEPEPYGIKEQPLFHESELHMVKGFDDEIARIFGENFTTQFTSGINVNTATALLLRAIIPELTEADADSVLKRRADQSQGGNFKNEQEFWTYLATLGEFSAAKARIEQQKLKLLGEETSYRVSVTGTSGQASSTWTALVGPLPPQVAAPPANPNDPNGSQQQPLINNPVSAEQSAANTQKKNDAQGLHILYLKAD